MQVVKDPLKTKGARLTMELTIAGRYLVFAPNGEGIGVSRRLDDGERDRARKQVKGLDLRGGGVIVRTAAARRQARRLRARAPLPGQAPRRHAQAGRGVHGPGHGLPGGRPVGARGPRHRLGHVRARDRRRRQAAPPADLVLQPPGARAVDRVELYEDDDKPLFERYGVEKAIEAVLLAPGGPAQRRLPDHRLRRGADGDRRQLRLVHRQRGKGATGGHDHEDEPRGGRRGRAPAAAARHRRHHRHRLHRHGPGAQPRRGAEDAAQGAGRGPHQDLRGRDLAARAWWR